MSTDVQTIGNSAIAENADSLLSQAIKAGASIDTLERLMALRKEMKAESAKEAFNEAMAAFQSECPVIIKSKSVNGAYKFAPIDVIVSKVKDVIQKHGFRYMTTMEFSGANVKVICRVVHALGHEEISSFEAPLGTKTGVMSATQVVAAASTFAKRYAFLNAFGIMTGDEDNDAKDMSKAPVKNAVKKPANVVNAEMKEKDDGIFLASPYELDEIKRLCKELDKPPVNEAKLLKYTNIKAAVLIRMYKKELAEKQELLDAKIQADVETNVPSSPADNGEII